MSITTNNPSCTFCNSTNVIKHGISYNGSRRYRCRDCEKTWVSNSIKAFRPEMHFLTEAYLAGKTFRDLVEIYHTSPQRLNQKIRKHLLECIDWEEYIDKINHEKRIPVIYLSGRSFACSAKGSINNEMYVAFAFDGLSSTIIGIEVGSKDSLEVWDALIGRLKERSYSCNNFMTPGLKTIETNIRKYYPASSSRINFYRAYREKEIECCLSNLPFKNKLVNDTIKLYNTLDDKRLSTFMIQKYFSNFGKYIVDNSVDYIDYIDSYNKEHSDKQEAFFDEFKHRFEKFHSIKDDPRPVINGWVAYQMLKLRDSGYNRLSFFLHVPMNFTFGDFAMKKYALEKFKKPTAGEIKSYVFEFAARSLNLPLNLPKCELSFDKCESRHHFH